MRKLITLAVAGLVSVPAMANNNTVFSCTTTEGKTLDVKKVGSDYAFTYGNISFKNPISAVMKNDSSFIAKGSGFITSSLELKDNNTSYTIEFSQPRNNSKHLDGVELSISRPNGEMHIIGCDTKKKISHKFDTKIMPKLGFDS